MTDKRTPMRYRDLVPNFRCSRMNGKTVVEVPAKYESMHNGKPTDDAGPSHEAHKMLRQLVHENGITAVYDEDAGERTGNHRAVTTGAHIPIERWNMVMGAKIPGWFWVPTNHEDGM